MTTTTETFAHLPLAAIVASLTNPRKTFNPERLAELAELIRADGVDTPVLVRPLPAHRVADTAAMHPRPTFELVSGERRFRASGMAGKTTIPAIIRALTDDQVMAKQLVENLQRDDLQPLEEAEGYSHLMAHHDPALTADDVAQRIGKSRSYVYARLKLLDLCPEAREALRQGHINAAVALLIARIPSHTVQAQALGNVNNPMTGQALSVRDASALIQRQYMLRLTEARFKPDDAALIPAAGACRLCPKRTGADPDLFADVPGADVCTDVACFRAKEQAHTDATLKAARESGATIIEGREAKELVQHSWSTRVDGFLRLDDAEDSPTAKPLRALIGKLMEKEGITATMVANPHKSGELIACIDHATAQRLLAQKGHQEAAEAVAAQGQQSARAAAEDEQRKQKEAFEQGWRLRVLTQAWKALQFAPSGTEMPISIARHICQHYVSLLNGDRAKRLAKVLELGKVAPKDALATLARETAEPVDLLLMLVAHHDVEYEGWRDKPEFANDPKNVGLMLVAADALVDVAAVKETVKANMLAAATARTIVQPGATCTGSQKPDAPLPSAAQAVGVRGAKGKKNPASPAPKKPKTSAKEAMQGIAAAMQGQGEEGGADSGPSGADPDGASAVGEEGRATSPDAGAALLVPGARVRFVGVHMTGQLGRIIEEATFGTGKWLLNVDGLTSEYVFEPHEFEVVADEQEAAA